MSAPIPEDLQQDYLRLKQDWKSGPGRLAWEYIERIGRAEAQVRQLRELILRSDVFTSHKVLCPHRSENMTSNSDCNCGLEEWYKDRRAALEATKEPK